MKTLSLSTNSKKQFLNITKEIQNIVKSSGIQAGICTIFCPHTTAALTINENADPDVIKDIHLHLDTLVPNRTDFRHLEGNSDGHIKTSLFGPSLSLIIDNYQLILGVWQGIFFTEFDGPRNRKIHIKIID